MSAKSIKLWRVSGGGTWNAEASSCLKKEPPAAG
jgi:hypothetical protein